MSLSKELLAKYIRFGFNLIPVKADKKPAVASWTTFQTKRVTFDDFMEMFNTAKRKGIAVTGLAVITGKISGITVVDLDKGSANPFEVITPISQTGGGGKHYFFKYTERLSTTSNRDLKIDIRNDGGYALIPPSVTLKGNYVWLKDIDISLAEVPQSFIDSYISGVVKNKWSFEGIEEGGRNNNSKSVIGAILRANRNDLAVSWELFKGWNQLNKPPIEEEQLRATFDWCVNKDLSNRPFNSDSFSNMTDDELLTFTQRETALTGVKRIDEGFKHFTGFYVICANPGVGKGWYALWLIREFYLHSNIKSVYISLEMTEDLIRKRVLQSWSDLDENAFNYFIKNKLEIKALALLKKDIMRVDEFGGSDTSKITTENFTDKIKYYYEQGFRAFHFDHLHELDGANDNTRNQTVTEKWAKVFQSICKDYSDIWLFIYVQPNGSSAKKQILKRTDISGSKAITQKCEFFISLNRQMKKDEETGEMVVDNDSRQITIYIDKNRISSAQHVGFKLYFLPTGNFSDTYEKDLSPDENRNVFLYT